MCIAVTGIQRLIQVSNFVPTGNDQSIERTNKVRQPRAPTTLVIGLSLPVTQRTGDVAVRVDPRETRSYPQLSMKTCCQGQQR